MRHASSHARLTAVFVLFAGLCPLTAQAGNYLQVMVPVSELQGPFGEFSRVQTNSHYDWFLIQGVQGCDLGAISLFDVTTGDGNPIITSVGGGGSFLYNGVMSDFLGGVFQVNSVTSESDGLRITAGFQLPSLLTGTNVELTFKLNYAAGSITVLKLHAAIPKTIPLQAFAIQNAYIDIDPEQGKFGGGGLFRLGSFGKTFGGWMDFKTGVGPDVGGRRFDVVKIGAGAGQLRIPIGTTGAFLQYVDGSILNDNGLSDPANWASSNFVGNFQIVAGEGIPLTITTLYPYVVDGTGKLDIHSGAIDITGTGKILGYFETANAHLVYTPPSQITVTGSFNSLFFSGDATINQKDGAVSGKLSGKLKIPDSVPLIGGKSLSGASAEFSGLTLKGSASIAVGLPRVCTPEFCPPALCIGYPSCDWCWYGPCDCGWRTICTPRACVPEICSPQLTKDISFDFTFDASTGNFNFSGVDLFRGAGTDAQPRGDAADLEFTPNWHSMLGSPLPPPNEDGPPAAEYEFELPGGGSGVLFRADYSLDTVTGVNMAVTTPDGLTFSSTEGGLPEGYGNAIGYSRFNPAAREQVVLLANPTGGTYRVRVNEINLLGTHHVQGLLQDTPPYCQAVDLEAISDGEYLVYCEGSQWPTAGIVSVNMVPQDGSASTEIFTGDAAAQTHSVMIDISELDLPAGNYKVTLAVQDGSQSGPQYCTSSDVIVVPATGRPDPPSSIRFLAQDGSARVLWAASPTEGVIGYLAQYGVERGMPVFDREVFVPADGNPEPQAELTNLENGVPVLVRVVAVGEETRRSEASPIVRITPMPAGVTRLPRIVSQPRGDATVGLNYVYLPVVMGPQEADTSTWTLDQAPAGMSIDPASGLMQWTPTAEELGGHTIIARITMQSDEGTTSAAQTFDVLVNPADDLSSVPEHGYSWVSYPQLTAPADYRYEYQPVVHGPDANIRYDLQVGPPGMTVDPASGLMTWDIPSDAKSQLIRLRAVVGDNHEMNQDFYLFIQGAENDWPADSNGLCGLGLLPFAGLISCLWFGRMWCRVR